jgi:hypothetical protein
LVVFGDQVGRIAECGYSKGKVWKSSGLRLGKVVGEAVAAELSRHVLDQRDEVMFAQVVQQIGEERDVEEMKVGLLA